VGEQAGHAFVGRIGQCHHRELLLRVDKPAVTVGAAPFKKAVMGLLMAQMMLVQSSML
jgi:hypothetical protein